jgi:hypothetical protein
LMITAERAKQHTKEELQALLKFSVNNMDKLMLEKTLVFVYNIHLDRQKQESYSKIHKSDLEWLI